VKNRANSGKPGCPRLYYFAAKVIKS